MERERKRGSEERILFRKAIGCSENGASQFFDEPLFGLLLADLLEVAEDSSLYLPSADSLSGSAEDHVEVHSIDTSGGVVLDSQVNVLFDSKSEVAY